MYFFIEKSRKFSQLFSNYNDVYIETIQEFYDKYQLPPISEWGDGFVQGEASDEQIIESYQFIDAFMKKGLDPEKMQDEGDWIGLEIYHEPIAHAFFDEDGDLQASDYFEWLDKEFITLLEENLYKTKPEKVFEDVNDMLNSKTWRKVRCDNDTDLTIDQYYEVLDYINNSITVGECEENAMSLYEAIDKAIDEVANQFN